MSAACPLPQATSEGAEEDHEKIETQQKIAIVIDANVLIKQLRLRDLLGASDDQEFNERYEVHTVKDVLKEIKDDNVRRTSKIVITHIGKTASLKPSL
jgi:hypothetical protein